MSLRNWKSKMSNMWTPQDSVHWCSRYTHLWLQFDAHSSLDSERGIQSCQCCHLYSTAMPPVVQEAPLHPTQQLSDWWDHCLWVMPLIMFTLTRLKTDLNSVLLCKNHHTSLRANNNVSITSLLACTTVSVSNERSRVRHLHFQVQLL